MKGMMFMKRILGLFLSLVIVLGAFSCLPVTVSAESADEIMFELNDDGESYSVTAYIGEYTDKLSIPSKYNGLPVTKIARFAFEHNDNIGSLFIPATIEEIDERAFYSCDYLKSFSVSSKSKYFSAIDGVLFNKDQTKLVRYPDNKKGSSYTIPDGVKYIATNAFEGSAPDEVILSEGVLSIGEGAFAHSGIEEIVFSDTVTEIGKEAFAYCESLEVLALPASLEKIGAGAFWDCDDLTSFTVASGSKYFSAVNGVLFNKAKTKLVQYPCAREKSSYTIPDGVKYIGAYAFAGNRELSKVIPSDDLVSIGNNAFARCGLQEFNIPGTVTKIGSFAFYECNIGKIVVPEGVTELSNGIFYGCNYLYSVTLPEGLKNIGSRAFFWCSSLKKITIPSTVISIGDEAFRGCPFTSIRIPENVTDIGQYVFFGCQFSSIKFPDSVKNIGTGALFSCENLKSVTIGKGLENIDVDVFAHCLKLESIKVDYENKNFTSVGGVLFNKAKTELIQYPRANSSTSYTVPDGVEKIWVIAFSGSDNLTSVVLPDSVTHIDELAFNGCDNLSSVKLGNGLKVIGDSAFWGCKKLKSITIPASVTQINERAFCDCEALSKITIKSKNINHIGRYTFSNTAYMNDTNNWENGSLYLNNYLIKVDSNVKGMYRIKDNTTVIADGAAEYNYQGITAVSIPNTVTNIGSNAFRCCGDIKAVFIPESVSFIGMEAFGYCDAIENIYYTGSKRQWNAIEIGDYNPILEKAQIHYNYVCAKPILKSIENTEYGVLIKWNSVLGADRYRVYRKTSKSNWKYIGYTNNTYYTDKTAKSGTKYYYAVKAISGAGNSSLSGALSVYYLEAPTLNTPSTSTKGVGLRWSEVKGAEGYLVYRKEAGGSYSRIATEKGVSNVVYRDTTAKKGTKYYYKVKAYYSKTQSACSNTKTIKDKY